MRRLIDFLFLKSYKGLAIGAFAVVLVIAASLVFGVGFLLWSVNQALRPPRDTQSDITYFNLDALEKVRDKIER
ncbi:MAG: hypothetical protein A2939_05000 [Parcubacteria group bacterium RIFCSPLOWO2_01_FULL_48_18]|nr:MAG: hypothetical protein A2939_05000 [Parcubacteria group bacterium RIFCSPLOWO2_01_FULL_48_18]